MYPLLPKMLSFLLLGLFQVNFLLDILVCLSTPKVYQLLTGVDKITQKISFWSSRHLSCAARCVLVNSVLMSSHTYWAQVFCLPHTVLNKIAQLCWAFLWKVLQFWLVPLLCLGSGCAEIKNLVFLGVRDCMAWNLAAQGRYIWQIALKADVLWVEWVHNVYIKDLQWWNYLPPRDASWSWKCICKARDALKEGFDTQG